MKIKNAILSCAMMAVCMTATAQEQTKTEFVFTPHWYVQVQPLGGQYTLGERSFGKLLSYNVQVAAGYQFNPVTGLRLAVNGWQSKAGLEYSAESMIGAQSYSWKWKYITPALDVTFNLSNLFFDYNPNRFFNLSVMAGVGANIGFDNDEAASAQKSLQQAYATAVPGFQSQNINNLWDGTKVRLQGRLGAMADFRVSDKVSVGLELQANYLNDYYNSKDAHNGDWFFNALAGVKINLGKTYTTKVVPVPVAERIIERIVEKPVERIVEKPVTAEVKKAELRREVFFAINKAVISSAEMSKVVEVADFLKANPEATVEITGVADKGTGNKSINAKLAEQRADAVANALTMQYGISANRIKKTSVGDTVQPFDDNAKNRVSICIAR